MSVKKYVADFETTTDPSDTRVWGWGMTIIGREKLDYQGKSLDEFMELIKDQDIDIAFHNLAFDGAFIVHWLLSHGWEHSAEPKPNTFNTIISNMGQWYEITIYWDKKRGKNNIKTTITDSYKLIPLSVENIAKSFNLPLLKLNIDYDKPRPIGYEPTSEEWMYIEHDIIIMSLALDVMVFENNMDKMTIGSNALSKFKKTMGYINHKGKMRDNFRFWYPVLPLDFDDFFRKAYRGGFTYLNPKFKEVNTKGLVYDVNSLYPSVLYNRWLPYGYPVYFQGRYIKDSKYPLYIIKISCAFEVKKDHIPTIQLKNNLAFIPTEYISSTNGEIIELTLTSVDFNLFVKHYNILNLDYHGGYKFMANNHLFKEYIDYWMNIKAHETGGKRQLAKLMLNSLYGKFGSVSRRKNKIPYLDDNGVMNFYYTEEEIDEPNYTALACFVTAYAREITISSAQLNYHRFIYADTDSLHLQGWIVPNNIKIHPTNLGAWKHETTFIGCKYIRAKTYIDIIRDSDGKDEIHVTCAGMPSDLHKLVTLDNFVEGAEYYGKLTKRNVYGGVCLVPTTFRIHPD